MVRVLVMPVEDLEALFDQRQQLIVADLEVMSGHDGAVDFLREQVVAGGFGEGRADFLEEAALSGQGFDDTLVFEFRVGFGDGVAVHPQLLGQGADGRQGFARAQAARGGCVAHLLHQLQVHRRAGERRFQVSVEGESYLVEVTEILPPSKKVEPAGRKAAASAVARSDGSVTSPMRGTIVELAVSEGATVTAGAVLFTVEAMKMENEVRAPCDGVVTGIQAHPGESVAAGATVMRVIPAKQG